MFAMMAAGRVTLLILTTALFAAAWSNDHEPLVAQQTEPSPSPYSTEPVRETVLHRWNLSKSTAGQQAWSPTPIAEAQPESADELPAGTYLVIDQQGRSQRVILPEAIPMDDPHAATGDHHYLIEFRGERCHWIRLTDNAKPTIADSADDADGTTQR